MPSKSEPTKTEDTLLNGVQYEYLLLKASDCFGHFWRMGYVNVNLPHFPQYRISNEDNEQLRRFAHDTLYSHFTSFNVSEDLCGKPDDMGSFTVTLV